MNIRNDYAPYVVPLGLFAVGIYLAPLFNISQAIVYPTTTILVTASLFFYFKDYKHDIRPYFDIPAVLAGLIVFVLWISTDNLYPHNGSSGFNPLELESAETFNAYWLIAFRLTGAIFVVPVMEELFWRSFALRFLINTRFKSVPLGKFTWFSFLVVSIGFGLEHHRWLPGIAAGLIYAGLLYRSKNLFSPILSHSVTNLLLGIYVLVTKQWSFW